MIDAFAKYATLIMKGRKTLKDAKNFFLNYYDAFLSFYQIQLNLADQVNRTLLFKQAVGFLTLNAVKLRKQVDDFYSQLSELNKKHREYSYAPIKGAIEDEEGRYVEITLTKQEQALNMSFQYLAAYINNVCNSAEDHIKFVVEEIKKIGIPNYSEEVVYKQGIDKIVKANESFPQFIDLLKSSVNFMKNLNENEIQSMYYQLALNNLVINRR